MHERIKELRKHLGLTQAEFGDKISMRQTGVAWLESGERKITTICAIFGADEIWLRTGEGEMFRKLSRDEQIAAFVGKALTDDSDEFVRQTIAMLAALDEAGWQKLKAAAEAIKEAEEKIKGS